MKTNKQISIIIPAFNEAKRITDLLDSIKQADYPQKKLDIIIVNDGSTDQTSHNAKNHILKPRVIDFQSNQGRFQARLAGAKSAKHSQLLFIDARSQITPDTLRNLNQYSIDKTIIGQSRPGAHLTPFEIFYYSIRRRLFRKYFTQSNDDIKLTNSNFDQYPKGTGLLAIKKDTFINICQNPDLIKKLTASDDTALLYQSINYGDLIISKNLAIINYGRTNFRESLNHLFHRGEKFIAYYHHFTQTKFLIVIVLPMVLLIATLILSTQITTSKFLLLLLVGWLLVSLAITTHIKYWFTNFYMLPVILITFYTGIIYGTYKQWLS